MTRANRQSETGRGARLLLSVLAASVALLALGAAGAAAEPAALGKATSTCWKDVVNDWLANQPNVKGHYPIACYTQAIQHLNAYVDIKQYSNAPDDIHRALLAAIQQNRNDGGSSSGGSAGPSTGGGGPRTPSGGTGAGSSAGGSGSGSGSSSSSSSSGSGGSGGGSSSSSSGTIPSSDKSFVTRLFDAVGPGDAQSVPLPLLVLAGLATLLLLAAAGTWLVKRLQARRMAPAPAPVRRQ